MNLDKFNDVAETAGDSLSAFTIVDFGDASASKKNWGHLIFSI